MNTVLLAALLLFQGIPALQGQTGSVKGTIKTADGKPAVAVRVSAMVPPESLEQPGVAAELRSIGETDEMGRYVLDNVPQGRYYIVAGRVDAPTYYPGTLEMILGRVVTVTAGGTLADIDFVMNNSSGGRPRNTVDPAINIPLVTLIEGGGKVPLFEGGHFPMIRITRVSDGMRTLVPLNTSLATIPPEPRVSQFQFDVEDLPETYRLKSVQAGAVGGRDLTGVTVSVLTGGPALAPIVMTLSKTASSSGPGVRVTGRIKDPASRSIYLSGRPGTIYSDGTWEVRGVPPGRHNVVTPDKSASAAMLGTSIVVGTQDVMGVELDELLVIPADAKVPTPPRDQKNYEPGPLGVRFASISGRAVDEATGEPLDAGRVIVNSGLAYSLNSEGRFEIRRVLPGQYSLEIWAFGVGSIVKVIDVDDGDIELDFKLGGRTP